jgi:hypothetical protein
MVMADRLLAAACLRNTQRASFGEKMMQRRLFAVLIAVLALSTLMACGGQTNNDDREAQLAINAPADRNDDAGSDNGHGENAEADDEDNAANENNGGDKGNND